MSRGTAPFPFTTALEKLLKDQQVEHDKLKKAGRRSQHTNEKILRGRPVRQATLRGLLASMNR